MSTNTRIEFFKNGVWSDLILKEDKAIKYNVVINKIGSMAKREISHSNTFELPYIHHNIQALGINVFNKTDLAKAFNSRYLARYYVNDKLAQKGYLIINNTNNGTINVNFIDEALEILENWGSENPELIGFIFDSVKVLSEHAMMNPSLLVELNTTFSKWMLDNQKEFTDEEHDAALEEVKKEFKEKEN